MIEEIKMSKGKSIWKYAWDRLKSDKIVVACMVVIALYLIIALLSYFGFIASDWAEAVGKSYQPPSGDYLFGTDIFGRDVLRKVIYGTQIAISIGFATCAISIPIGLVLGALAGYFGGWVDDLIVWFYSTVSSIPRIMLLISITFVLGKGLSSIYIALGITGWVGLCRMIRGEVLKHKNREYVQAARAIGASHARKLFIHIIPNVFHMVIIYGSLQFIYAIKSEVILSFIGIGAIDKPSWGIMISDARLELSRGVWWQLAAATFAMFFIVLAFNIFGDAFRDAMDPKLKGRD